MLSIQKIATLDELGDLKEEWTNLLKRSPVSNPFLSPDFVWIWWRNFGVGKELCTFVVRENGRAVLIAPLMKYFGHLYRKVVRLPALVMESLANYHSNISDLIYEELNPEHLRALWDHLLDKETWDLIRMFPIAEDSPTVKFLQDCRVFDSRLDCVLTLSHASPYLPIEGSWETYAKQLSKRLRYKVRRAEREGLTWEFVTAPQDPELLMDEVLSVSERGWAEENKTAISSTRQLRGFYRDLAYFFNEKGDLFMALLKGQDRVIAFEYNLISDGTMYVQKIAFDQAFAKLNPGHLLKYHTLEEVFQSHPDIRVYDFLGDASEYKMMWTSHTRRYFKAFVYDRARIYSTLLRQAQHMMLVHPTQREKVLALAEEKRAVCLDS